METHCCWFGAQETKSAALDPVNRKLWKGAEKEERAEKRRGSSRGSKRRAAGRRFWVPSLTRERKTKRGPEREAERRESGGKAWFSCSTEKARGQKPERKRDGGLRRELARERRLSIDQVKALEKNFGAENKLEPERKVKLAQELGLQPRQVAVWFHNRRARWKTKQLERDYGVLKANDEALKLNYDGLKHDNEGPHKEIQEDGEKD
ncbi:hypothetical protein BT93_L2423 [Corymbia citriodora subsp. variegata]|uniref:Homeobox-leucine zipper protein n=1 Tax=Corymbia citriodora subsp. variegata TaxID=360336 RepID=A0A8T0CPE8_CORYI|nr:hypothetical protein BT93_L2423 [Corymbia citriodora subsp. variegata]